MKSNFKKAKVVDKFKVMCPHCLTVRDASPWAVAHSDIEIIYTCDKCAGKSIIKPNKLGGYGGRRYKVS